MIVAIDNGVTGTIAILSGKNAVFVKTPVKVEPSYQKPVKRTKKQMAAMKNPSLWKTKNISRVQTDALIELFSGYGDDIKGARVVLERPMTNPGRYAAAISAARALEATLVALEFAGFQPEQISYIDSKEWQSTMLPMGLVGEQFLELKERSLALKAVSAIQSTLFYPEHSELIKKHGDGDALLIARHILNNVWTEKEADIIGDIERCVESITKLRKCSVGAKVVINGKG